LVGAVAGSIFVWDGIGQSRIDMEDINTWNEDYNTGVKFLDEQHRYFFHIINALKQNLNEGVCKDSAAKIFFSLAHYAEHFLIQEEIYFRDYHFPGLKQHKDLHKAFIRRVIQFQSDYERDVGETCLTMLAYLEQWFEDHILKYDKEAIDYLRQKGL
jgi:hemerythrin